MLALWLLLWADPASFEALLRSGLTALNQNQFSTAQTQLEAASKLKPNDPPGYQPLDEHNPDRKKRGEPMCNHIMMGGFHPSKDPDVTWDGGWIYDPDHGLTYSGKITLVDKDTVKLRGFIGISLLGRTLVLHRQATPPRLCDDPDWKPMRAAE